VSYGSLVSIPSPWDARSADGGADGVRATLGRIREAVERVVEGKDDVVRTALVVLLAEGHLLVEDVPGVGKTMLAKTLARATGVSVRRVQFTPDLLPSDLTGVSIYDAEARRFDFKPGPVFAHVVVGDEINRASPKTQSALLECMGERTVTVDGTTHTLARPFMVVATQNPAEMEGTYPLPEAQRDRFMARVSMGYPSPASEMAMLANHGARDPLSDLEPVSEPGELRRAIAAAAAVHASPAVQQYLLDLVTATRSHPAVSLGASPRASLHLLRASRAVAAIEGRGHVLPDDVQSLVVPVLAHRLVLSSEAAAVRRTPEDVLAELLQRVPVPSASRV